MGNELLSAKTDIVFKKIFIENKDLLQDFLANMLDIPSKDIVDITIKNTEIQPDSPDGKVSRLDLNMTVNEMRVNVEIQVRKQTDYKERSLFYWSKLFTSDFKSGDPYRKLKKTITIVTICMILFMLAGCTIHINEPQKSPEELIENQQLAADPVEYDSEGTYNVTFHYDNGGFADMDLSQAYVCFDPVSVLDQIENITGESEFPELPQDALDQLNEAIGEGGLVKVAIITVKTVDDNTLEVSFTDTESPIPEKEYFFVIPNEELAGSFIPE